jgi:hypothetical protein
LVVNQQKKRSTTNSIQKQSGSNREIHANFNKPLELDADISALNRSLNQLTEVDSSAALVNVYYSALSLVTRIAEHPSTVGERQAGLYLRDKIGC